MPPELRLIVAPRQTYAELVAARRRVSALTALRRPAVAALVLGLAVAMSAVNTVTAAAALSVTIAFSYIIVLQLAIALAFVAPLARRTIGVARAVDLFFAAHVPWSLFVLAAAAWSPSPLGRPGWPLVAVAPAALLLTIRIVDAFFGEVLGLDRRAARRLTFAHQAVTWTIAAVLFWQANALTPRAAALLGYR